MLLCFICEALVYHAVQSESKANTDLSIGRVLCTSVFLHGSLLLDVGADAHKRCPAHRERRWGFKQVKVTHQDRLASKKKDINLPYGYVQLVNIQTHKHSCIKIQDVRHVSIPHTSCHFCRLNQKRVQIVSVLHIKPQWHWTSHPVRLEWRTVRVKQGQ